MTTVLVVGARRDSVGAAVVHQAQGAGYEVVRAGITEEEVTMNLVADDLGVLREHLVLASPTHVVCTVGINQPGPGREFDDGSWYQMHFEANVIGPMRLLRAWQDILREVPGHGLRHFVAISSNSARLPRSGSAAYCASKAALSMALRVKAREGAAHGSNLVVYGYEPGLLAATPMTADTVAQFGPGAPLTRMRDVRLGQGIPASQLAWMVVANLSLGLALNGVLFPFDADEA